jgi:hypothetical protein
VKLRQHVSSFIALGLAVVCAAAIFLERGKITDTERQDRSHDVFPAYRRGDIDSIELLQGSARVKIERRSDLGDAGETHWQMTSPVDERADPAAVDRFIGDLEFAGAIRKVDAAASPAIGGGFDAPRVRGTLAMKSLVYHFALGGPAPIPDGAAYFRVDGEGTFVISKDFVSALLNPADVYRERTVVPYLSLDLAGLEVQPGGAAGDGADRTGFAITRVDDISFKLVATGARVSRDVMDKVWGALAEARAESFLSDADADRAIGPSPLRVLMTPKDPKKPKGELHLGGACPGHADDIVLVRVAPSRASACVPKGSLPGLLTTADALVDHRLFAARADEVEEIVLEAVPAGLTVELARKGRGWHERKPTDRELSGTEIDTMNELVTKLTRGDAVSVDPVEPARPGEAKPAFAVRARVRIRRGNSGVDEVVELGPGTEIVRRDFDGRVLHVPSALGRRLWPSEIALRGRAVFPNGLDGRTPTTLESDCDGVRQSLTHESTDWIMREPAGFRADPLATADLAGLVRNAQAESWVADDDDGSFGFDQSTCKVSVGGAGDGGTRSLGIVFGKEAEGGAYYAHVMNDHAVFLAPRGLREGPNVWLIDRGGFRADPSAVETITLTRGAAHAVFAANRQGIDGGVSATTAKILEALEVLRPEAVIHLGAPKPAEGFGAPTLDVRVKLAGDSGAKEIHFVFGDTALVNRERLVYARVDGVNATYGILKDRLGGLVGAL